MATGGLGEWQPLAVEAVAEVFEHFPARWWLSGGHALEAHFERSWRKHDDVDVSLRRDDLPALFAQLDGWDVHVAAAGQLSPWSGEPLSAARSQNNLWCRRDASGPWELDVTISDGDDAQWIYRRDRSVRVHWDAAVLHSSAGRPYLAPNLQLLYKSVALRPKDDRDAAICIEMLDGERRDWLGAHLPAAHPWQRLLGRRLAAEAASALGLDGPVIALSAGRSSQAWLVGSDDVIRVPVPNSDRRASYLSESRLSAELTTTGVTRTPQWRICGVRATACTAAPRLQGAAIEYDDEWTTSFAAELASTLAALHSLHATGYGPLVEHTGALEGISASRYGGIVDRWFHASIWPFDGSDFADHAVHDVAPDLAVQLGTHATAIQAAEAGPIGIVHSDLHREHLLANANGDLTGLLDFGDAFVGAVAWDFALLLWYYGAANLARFASHYPDGAEYVGPGQQLAIAVGLYKLSKNPADPAVVARLRRLLEVIEHR